MGSEEKTQCFDIAVISGVEKVLRNFEVTAYKKFCGRREIHFDALNSFGSGSYYGRARRWGLILEKWILLNGLAGVESFDGN